MMRDPRLVTDINLEPTPASDAGRLLALLESRFWQQVPVYELAAVAKLQYSARCHSLRHNFGFVLLNGEGGRTADGRKKTWFALIGRLNRAQLARLEELCHDGMRYNAAIVEVFPETATYLKGQNQDRRSIIRDYPTPSRRATVPSVVTASFPQFGTLARESYGVD